MPLKGEELSQNVNAIIIARQHFLEGRTKSEIAKSFGLNRFKVARIVEKCLSDGLVEIVLHYPADFVDYGLSAELKALQDLNHALVVHNVGGSVDTLFDPLGRAAATQLREGLTAHDVLGFAWTRALEAMPHHLDKLKAKAVVQLCGAFPGAGNDLTSVERSCGISASPQTKNHCVLATDRCRARWKGISPRSRWTSLTLHPIGKAGGDAHSTLQDMGAPPEIVGRCSSFVSGARRLVKSP